jgi:ankyrin repeat/BTB/POZ domain-containing protein 2
MSDNGNSSPRGNYSSGPDRLTAGVMQKSVKNRATAQHSRSRHRATPARVSKLLVVSNRLKY